MNLYLCRAVYPSILYVPYWDITDAKQAVASDFVMAEDAEKARNEFYRSHRGNIGLFNIEIEFRAVIDFDELCLVAMSDDIKPVGDMALFDYWEWVQSARGKVA